MSQPGTASHWELASGQLGLDTPVVVGIVNLTPDSFSDGGNYTSPAAALAHALALVEQGAQMLDLGAESTRPGARPVASDVQLRRLQPLLDTLTDSPVPLSLDTSDARIISMAAQHPRIGAINDVRALQQPGALEALANTRLGVCLMHMQGSPQTMQHNPSYANPLGEVADFLCQRAQACQQAGVAAERIAIDPGFGFGKTTAHNLALFAGLDWLAGLGYPLLVGVSRKRMLGDLTGRDVADRDPASALAAALAHKRGAQLLRVHNPAVTLDALRLLKALDG